MSTRRRRSIFDILDGYFENIEEWAESFRERLIERPSWDCRASTIEPLRNTLITPTEVIVTVDLPYAEENTVEVKTLGKDTIEVLAKMKRKIRLDDFGITHYEGEFKMLRCQARIPVPVYTDAMKVHFRKGILEVRLRRKNALEIPIE